MSKKMLKLTEIIDQYPTMLQKHKKAILREYLQHKILSIIFQSKQWEKLSFIWWTALRIIYNNNRFSEDLDFDNKNLSFKEFEELWVHIKNMLELEALNVEIINKEKQAFHCNIKFSDILFDNELSTMRTEKISIKIDTFDQWFKYNPQINTIDKFDTFSLIKTTPINILLAQKLHTAFDRKKTKGRDFFDIIFILSKTKKPNYEYLKQKIGVSTKSELKNYILKKSANLNFDDLQKDVANFLFNPHDQSVKLFPEYIKSIEFEE